MIQTLLYGPWYMDDDKDHRVYIESEPIDQNTRKKDKATKGLQQHMT